MRLQYLHRDIWGISLAFIVQNTRKKNSGLFSPEPVSSPQEHLGAGRRWAHQQWLLLGPHQLLDPCSYGFVLGISRLGRRSHLMTSAASIVPSVLLFLMGLQEGLIYSIEFTLKVKLTQIFISEVHSKPPVTADSCPSAPGRCLCAQEYTSRYWPFSNEIAVAYMHPLMHVKKQALPLLSLAD